MQNPCPQFDAPPAAAASPPTLEGVLGRIRAWGRAVGLTPPGIAELAGLSRGVVFAIERGRPVSGRVILKIEALIPSDFSGYAPPRSPSAQKSSAKAAA